jgi:hypothetical protein
MDSPGEIDFSKAIEQDRIAANELCEPPNAVIRTSNSPILHIAANAQLGNPAGRPPIATSRPPTRPAVIKDDIAIGYRNANDANFLSNDVADEWSRRIKYSDAELAENLQPGAKKLKMTDLEDVPTIDAEMEIKGIQDSDIHSQASIDMAIKEIASWNHWKKSKKTTQEEVFGRQIHVITGGAETKLTLAGIDLSPTLASVANVGDSKPSALKDPLIKLKSKEIIKRGPRGKYSEKPKIKRTVAQTRAHLAAQARTRRANRKKMKELSSLPIPGKSFAAPGRMSFKTPAAVPLAEDTLETKPPPGNNLTPTAATEAQNHPNPSLALKEPPSENANGQRTDLKRPQLGIDLSPTDPTQELLNAPDGIMDLPRLDPNDHFKDPAFYAEIDEFMNAIAKEAIV